MSEKQALKIEVEPTGEFLEVLRKARNALADAADALDEREKRIADALEIMKAMEASARRCGDNARANALADAITGVQEGA